MLLIIINSSNKPEKFIVEKHQKIYTDIFQYIYIQQNNSLKKIDTTGKILCSYSNNNFGNISIVDVSNPLQILVYYNLYNYVQLLSNNLTPLSPPISLDEIGFTKVSAICSSEKGGIWIYDEIKKKLVFINSKLEIVFYGTQIPILSNIIKMFESNGKVYIGTYNMGLYIFDSNGNFLQFMPIENFLDFYVYNQQVIIATNKYLKKNENIVFRFKVTPKSIAILKKHILISNNDTLFFYKH